MSQAVHNIVAAALCVTCCVVGAVADTASCAVLADATTSVFCFAYAVRNCVGWKLRNSYTGVITTSAKMFARCQRFQAISHLRTQSTCEASDSEWWTEYEPQGGVPGELTELDPRAPPWCRCCFCSSRRYRMPPCCFGRPTQTRRAVPGGRPRPRAGKAVGTASMCSAR